MVEWHDIELAQLLDSELQVQAYEAPEAQICPPGRPAADSRCGKPIRRRPLFSPIREILVALARGRSEDLRSSGPVDRG
jgi:hypothetical protein